MNLSIGDNKTSRVTKCQIKVRRDHTKCIYENKKGRRLLKRTFVK